MLLSSVGVHMTNESVCEIMQSCFRICFEMRLSGMYCSYMNRILIIIHIYYMDGQPSDSGPNPACEHVLIGPLNCKILVAFDFKLLVTR